MKQIRWISTRSVSEWNGEKYVTVVNEGYWYSGKMALCHDVANVGLQAWRIYDNTGAALFAQDTDANSLSVDTDYQLRFQIDNDGAADEIAGTYTLEYSLNAATFVPITTSTPVVKAVTAGLVDGTATSDVLTGGQAGFQAGEECTDGTTASFTLGAAGQIEFVYGITIVSANVANTDAIDFRITLGGTVLDFETVATTISVSEAGFDGVLDAQPNAFTFTGSAATLEYSRVLSSDSKAFTFTGIASTLTATKELNLNSNAFTLSGIDSSTTVTRELNSSPNAYTFTGVDVTFARGFELSLNPNSFTFTGIDSSTTVARELNSSPNAYAFTGIDVTFARGFEVSLDPNAFTFTGIDSSAIVTRESNLNPNAYTLTGIDVAFSRGFGINLSPNAFTLTGVSSSLIFERGLSLNPKAFTFTGVAAAFIKTDSNPVINNGGGGFKNKVVRIYPQQDNSDQETIEAVQIIFSFLQGGKL